MLPPRALPRCFQMYWYKSGRAVEPDSYQDSRRKEDKDRVHRVRRDHRGSDCGLCGIGKFPDLLRMDHTDVAVGRADAFPDRTSRALRPEHADRPERLGE